METLSKTATVNRDLSPREVLEATGRRWYSGFSAEDTMPSSGSGVQKGVIVKFFRLEKFTSFEELFRQYDELGLAADPYSLSQVNIDDRFFADQHPNCSVWIAADRLYFITFDCTDGSRNVTVGCGGRGLSANWWPSGVSKNGA